jgi:hypothetical protein
MSVCGSTFGARLMPKTNRAAISYLAAGDAPSPVLVDRVTVAMTMPHNHPGIAGRADGDGCPRCNAEHALRALVARAEDFIDFTPRRPRWRVLRGGATS